MHGCRKRRKPLCPGGRDICDYGTSTLLRCINRLIKPTSGEVIINGRDISNVTDKELLRIRRKELAMVFQHYGLLPHRSVLHNIAFGLELQGVKKQEREHRAMESMQLVGLKGTVRRDAATRRAGPCSGQRS